MTYEVYINEQLIEIDNPKLIGFTFQVGSIFNPETRSGNLSNQFRAPKTQRNNIVLKNLSNINSDTNFPYEKITAKVVQNGIEIVPNGFALIDSTDDNYYYINIYSGNVSFFDLIKGLNVSDLDFDDLNHVYGGGTIKTIWEGNLGYNYPIIEWGQEATPILENNQILHAEDLIPCLNLKTTVDRTLARLQYNLKGTFKDSNEFAKMVVTPQNFGISDDDAEELDGYAKLTTLFYHDTGYVTDDTEVEIPLTFGFFSQPNFSGQNYTPTNDIWGRVFFHCDLTPKLYFDDYYSFDVTLRAEVYEDGNLIGSSSLFRNIPVNYFAPKFTLNAYSPFMYLRSASVYSFKVFSKVKTYYLGSPYVVDSRTEWYSGNTFQIENYTIPFNCTSNFNVEVKRVLSYGNIIPMSLLYNIPLDSIFRDIMNMYCLVMQTNEVTKEISLNKLNVITDNIPINENWSSKLDPSKKINVNYKVGNYGQSNILQYKETSDVPKEMGKGELLVSNVNLPKEKKLIEVSASAATTKTAINNHLVPKVPIKTTRVEALKDVNHRYFMIDKISQSGEFRFAFNESLETTFATDNFPLAYFQKTGKTDSLDFPSLITANYGTLQGMLDKTKVVSAYFRLTEIDVVNIDFTIPIYLDINTGTTSINGYFYINKISNFKVDSSTLCELIRL